MSARAATFENTWKIRFRDKGKIKTALVVARDHKRAEGLARRYSGVISVSKAQRDYLGLERERLVKLGDSLMRDIAKPQMTPLAMDEFIWMRRKRIENRNKDKKYLER